ncbi:MAG: AI-2E family transporter [Phormidesmis sp.]
MKLGDWMSLLCLVAASYILWTIRPLLLLFFAAVVVAIALNNLTRQVRRFNVPRSLAIPIAIGIATLVAVLFVLGIVPPFVDQFRLLIKLLIGFSQTLPDRLSDLQTRLPERIRLPDLSEFITWLTSPDSAAINVFGNFFSFFNSSLRVALQTLFVTVLAIMMLVNPAAYLDGFLLLFPAFYRQRAREIFAKCELALGNWLGGIIISSVFVFALSFISLIILGVDLAFAHALLAGILNFIPNLGPTLSMVFPVVVALISDDPWKAIAVVVLYIIIQQIESYWLTPTIMAHQVALLPAFTLIAQIFFAGTFGFLGLLLALPLTVVAKTWLQELLIKDVLNTWKLPANDLSSSQLVSAIALTPPSITSPNDANNQPAGPNPESPHQPQTPF